MANTEWVKERENDKITKKLGKTKQKERKGKRKKEKKKKRKVKSFVKQKRGKEEILAWIK